MRDVQPQRCNMPYLDTGRYGTGEGVAFGPLAVVILGLLYRRGAKHQFKYGGPVGRRPGVGMLQLMAAHVYEVVHVYWFLQVQR